ncbi:hypothetical protein KO501_15500 [Alteromonas sp. C1M14]|nr:hypothetical protein [Alteromonas sp. C1M14]
MKHILVALLVSLVVNVKVNASDEIVVVAHTLTSPPSLEKHEIRNLFMGGASDKLTPVMFVPGVKERLIFNTRVVGLTESRIQSYWAQMRFSGRNHVPVEVETVDDMLEYLLQHEGSVGYLPADISLPPQLTIIYKTG